MESPHMKFIARTVVLAVTLFSPVCFGATAATRPASNPSMSDYLATQFVDALDLPAGMSVADMLRRVQHEAPDFQYVAKPGPWQNYALPEMKLRRVSLSQIANILTTIVPGLQVANITNGYNVYVFHSFDTGPTTTITQLDAFGLADPIALLGSRNAWADLAKDEDAPTADQIAVGRKKALKEVLSLLESAVSQADPSFEPSLKLHEETEVLLVRGTPQQIKAVSQSLQAIQSTETSKAFALNYQHLARQYQSAENTIFNLKDELGRVSRGNKSMANRILELEKENAALKDPTHPTPAKSGTDEKR